MYIDTHCHLSKDDYDNVGEVIEENRKNLVSPIVISGCSRDSIEESIHLSEEYDDIYVTIGYHPSEVSSIEEDDFSYLISKLQNRRVVGVGEIGLDYYYGKEDKEQQIILFERQLQLAEQYQLPVVIHSRDAVADTISILKKYSVKGIIHCFSGSIEVANIYIKLGFLLGIGGVLTFKNSNLSEVVRHVGVEHCVLETDSPYLTPVPFRGQKNSSKNIPIIVERMAELLQVDVSSIALKTSSNACNLFDFDSHL